MKRPTIHDIARAAGVSKSAVSYALNGQPGVSPETRQRILAYAKELGWHPSTAARALRGLGAATVGLVLARTPLLLRTEPYFMQLVAGIAEDLGPAHVSLALEVVGEDLNRELEVYRRWWSQARVDGVFVVDLRVGDPRVPLLRKLRIPAVMMSRPQDEHDGLPAVWIDDAEAMRTVIEYLAKQGHRRIAYVNGIPGFVQTVRRKEAFVAQSRAAGMSVSLTRDTDYGAEQGDIATAELLERSDRPTAIVYDNDVMAVSAIKVAQRRGLRVPRDLSLIAWDDSPLCRYANPAMTAIQGDVTGFGTLAARTLRRVISGAPVFETVYQPAVLVQRESTGQAPEG